MKTLKTIFLFLVLVCAGNSFGQTKEETIEWLETNGLNIAGGPNLSYKIDNDTLFVYMYDFNCNLKNYSKVHLKDILFEKLEGLVKRNIFDCEVKAFDIRTKENKVILFRDKIEEPDTGFVFFFYNEENAKRVIKAIMHLAKLSGAKENKQTF